MDPGRRKESGFADLGFGGSGRLSPVSGPQYTDETLRFSDSVTVQIGLPETGVPVSDPSVSGPHNRGF